MRFSCGGAAPAWLTIGSQPVSDGRWHSVLLEVDPGALRLTLDRQRSASVGLAQPCRMLRSHGDLLFASSSAADEAQRASSFVGCLRGLALDHEPIAVGEAGEWAGPGSRRVFGVYRCCGGEDGDGDGDGPCHSNPCQNGGACEDDAAGGESGQAVGRAARPLDL